MPISGNRSGQKPNESVKFFLNNKTLEFFEKFAEQIDKGRNQKENINIIRKSIMPLLDQITVQVLTFHFGFLPFPVRHSQSEILLYQHFKVIL